MDPFCYFCFVLVCHTVLSVHCSHLLGKGWPLGFLVCDVFLIFCHFIGVVCDVWYLIVPVPDLCLFPHFMTVDDL